jgi:glycosyltransferase involved in cell wall biosynthesis
MLDALVLPSYREGFGNVVIEAEAMGVPVLVSDIAGPIDAIEVGVTGLKFKVKSVKDLREIMEKGLEFKNNEFGKNAVEFVVERFDSNKLNEEILKRKNQLLG